MPQLLYLWERTPAPLNRRFGGLESQAGCLGEVKTCFSKDSNPGSSSP